MGNASSPLESLSNSLMSTRAQPSASSEGIDNFQLPKALVTRIAKSALPPEAKLQKDTINTFVNVTTVFINYLAATAQDVAASRSRKTIAGPDILKALEIIEFGDLVPSLQTELDVYRSMGKADKSKGTATGADVKGKGKGKEKEPSLTSTAAHAKAALPVDNVHDSELEPTTMENAEEQEESGVEDVGVAVTGPQKEEEEEEEGEEGEQEDGVVDEDVGIAEAGQQEEEEEVEEDMVEEVEDDAADEAEEIVDTFAIEEEELDTDARGLEESAPQNEE